MLQARWDAVTVGPFDHLDHGVPYASQVLLHLGGEPSIEFACELDQPAGVGDEVRDPDDAPLAQHLVDVVAE